MTSRPATATSPPRISRINSTAARIASSLQPTTMMLCASWATVDARAPSCSPKPRTKPRPRRPEVVERDQVRAPARGDRPAVAQPKVFGRVEAGQLERQEWVQTQDDRLPDHGVDMTLVQQGDRRPVVGAEDKAP